MLKNLFMIGFTYVQTRYTNNFGKKVQRRFMRFFLGASYQETFRIELAQKEKILRLLTENITNNFLFRLLNLGVNILIFVFISACLAVKFPAATISAFLFGLIMLILQNKIYKPYLSRIAKNISESTLLYNQALNDALLNIKSVKASNNEKYFYDNYNMSLNKYNSSIRKNGFLSAISPFVTEPFAIILLFVLVAIISGQTYAEPQKLVASLTLVAAAIFRLTPAIARIQVNLNGLNSAIPLVKEFFDIYESYKIDRVPDIMHKEYIGFNTSLELNNISFGYSKDKKVLKDINLKIKKGEFIGIAGASGAGKTTLADVISGLYKPDSGEILVDGAVQNKPLKEFVLIKGSIRENVALGNPQIDDERVIDALKKAQLYDYIINNFKEGIYANPFIDYTGFSLGQKQRLAVARALYQEPDILIFDEATSALDVKTEEDLCGVLNTLKGVMTIIVIAHRLSTLKDADRIILIKNGMAEEVDGFEELNAYFRSDCKAKG